MNPRSWPFSTPLPTFGNPPLPDMSLIAVVDMEKREIVHTILNTVEFDYGQLAWSPDGTQITAIGRRANSGHGTETGEAETVMVFDARSGAKVASEKLVTSSGSLRYTPDGKYLIESDMTGRNTGWGIRIWDGQHKVLLQEIVGDVRGLAVSRDGHYFAAGGYKKFSVWQLK